MLAAALLLGACDTTIDPFQESNRYFSVFGFLDANADSQFVRITPVRDSIALAPDRPLDATVTLEALASGQTIPLRDSLFGFEDRVAYNFWSAQPLEHGATYRLRVARSDGAGSVVTVTLPAAYPDPELLLPEQRGTPVPSFTAAVRITGVERLADLRIRIKSHLPGQQPGTQTIVLSFLDRVATLASGLGVQFRPYQDFFRHAPGCPIVDDVQVTLAAAGPDWPDFLVIDDETLALADVVTNVENGVGFLGGVSRKTMPWDALKSFLVGTQPVCVQCTSFFPDPALCFGG